MPSQVELNATELLRAHLQARVSLTEADFATFCGYLRPLALGKHQQLLRAGEVCRAYAFVTHGCLRSYSLTAEGQEHTLQFAPEEWWISDLYSLLTGQPGTLYIDALEDTQLLLLNEADLETIYVRCPVFERYFRLLSAPGARERDPEPAGRRAVPALRAPVSRPGVAGTAAPYCFLPGHHARITEPGAAAAVAST